MTIRSHLVLLVGAALLPVLILATILTGLFWREQRDTFYQRYLDGVRAMTIALESEIEASTRVMQSLSLTPDIDHDDLVTFAARARRVISSQPAWSTLALVNAAGTQLMRVRIDGDDPRPVDRDTVQRAIRLAQPAISPLISPADGTHWTEIAVPVIRHGVATHALVAGIQADVWVRFLSQYPVPVGGTVTINDQTGVLVARTLEPERWVGRRSSSAFLDRIRGGTEGSFRIPGVDGRHYYTAFRRSERWGWIVGTGVPVSDVEKALRGSTMAVAGGALLLVALALGLAVLLGKRIAQPVSALAQSAAALAGGAVPPARRSRSIAEVGDVERAFDEARTLLARRQEALNRALRRERVARAEAERASRGKDEFLAMLGHELRNPLGAVASAAAVLQRAGDNTDAVSRAQAIIGRQVTVLTKVVDDLLDVARVTTGKIVLDPAPLDLGQAIRHAIDVLTAAGRLSQHDVVLDLAEAWSLADATRIEQIVANLVENAAKYTPPGGRISVTLRPDAGDAVLEVRDTGMGIEPDLLPVVFDLFAQEQRARDRAQGGLGLGLTLVRRLVDLHGGRITAASEGRGTGATFTVRLPRIDPPAGGAVPGAPPTAKIRPLRILLVEDNADGRAMLRQLLRLDGHDVHEALDGLTGVVEASSVQPDVAIIDIGLPGIDGYEVARRVRATPGGKRMTLVAVTGYGAEEDKRLASAAGFDAYLVKPVTPQSLAEVLARVESSRGGA